MSVRLRPNKVFCSLVFMMLTGFFLGHVAFCAHTASALDYLVQSGETILASGDTTDTVPLGTTVDKSHSFFFVFSTNYKNGNTNPSRFLVNGQLQNDGTGLTLRRNVSGEIAYVSYSVIQHPQISVQEGTHLLSAGVGTADINISSVDTTKSFVIIHRRGDAARAAHNDTQVTGHLFNATTLRLQRNASTTDCRVRWQVVTFSDATTVQTGERTFGSTETLVSVNIGTPVDLSRSWVYMTVRCAGGSGMAYSIVRGLINATDTVQFERTSTSTTVTPTVRWFVVEFPSGQQAAVQKGTAWTTATTDTTIGATLPSPIDPTETFLYHTNRGNGGGTAYPRPYWINRFSSCGATCSGVEFERWYSGQHGAIAWQAVKMPVCPTPDTPGNPSPADASTGISVDADLDWDDASGADSYDVYFGTADPPPYDGNTTTSDYTLGTLTADTTYYWKIAASNSCGDSEGPVWSFTTCPPAPGTPSNPVPNNGAVEVSVGTDLDWDNASNTDSYDVYFGTAADPPFYTNTATSDTTLPTLSSNTLYYWKIVAKNACGDTAGSVWNFTTCTAPGTPSNPSPANGAAGVSLDADLDWDDTSLATSYDVYFGTAADPPFYANTPTSDLTLPSLLGSTTYYWKIVAKNSCGDIAGSVWSFTTCTTPGTPSNPSPANGASGVSVDADLDWADASNTDSYDVYFGTANPPPYVGNTASSSYMLGTLNTSTTYYWKIVAKNACGNTEGAVWSFTTCPPAPGTPGTPSPDDASTDVSVDADLDWADSSDTDSYDVYFGTAADPPFFANTAGSSLTLDRLDCGTTYYWKIVAKNTCANTTGLIWSFTTESMPTPGTPSSPSPSNGATDVSLDVDLDWADASNTESYDVYFGTTDPPPYDGNTASSDYTLPALNSATQYYWQVVAKNRCDTAAGPVWSFTTLCLIPGTPANPIPAHGATGVSVAPSLDWDDAINTDSYDVYFGTAPNPPFVGNTATSSYDPGTLGYETQYYWKVVAKNDCGNSTPGSIWSFTTGLCPSPGTPSDPSPGDGVTGVSIDADLDWAATDNTDSYDLYFGTATDPPFYANTTASSYVLPTLSYSTQYYWKIVAKNDCGSATTGPIWDFTTAATPVGNHFAWLGGSNTSPYDTWGKASHTIQAAVNAASAGETVLVRGDDTYGKTFTGNVTINKSNLTLQSETGQDSTFIVGSVTFDASAANISGSTLDGFSIHGVASSTGLIYLHTKIPYDYDAASDYKITNTTIKNCAIYGNTGGDGIILRGHVSPTISANVIYGNSDKAIEVYLGSSFELGSTGSPIVIKGNNIYENGDFFGGGIYIAGYSPTLWTDPPEVDVTIGGSGAGEANTIRDSMGHFATGLRLGYLNVAIVKNNTIESNNYAGIRSDNVADLRVKGNEICYNNYAGIYVAAGPTTLQYHKFTIGGTLSENGNEIHNNGNAGIIFYTNGILPYQTDITDSLIQNNFIHHNSRGGIAIGRKWESGGDGQTHYKGKMTITQNNIYANAWGGIGIHTGCELDITKNNISYSTARGGIHTGDEWGRIYVYSNRYPILTIKQNRVHHNYLGGIDIRHAHTTSACVINNNIVYNNSRAGIRIGPGVDEVINNTVAYNGDEVVDKGPGIVFDDPDLCDDPGCQNGADCAADCRPDGVVSTAVLIRNNIMVDNWKAGLRVGGYSYGDWDACPDNNNHADGYLCRNYNLLYGNYPWNDIFGRDNPADCGWPGINRSCIEQQYGGCGMTATWPWELINADDKLEDPLFEAGTDNYNLADGSPAIDAGVPDASYNDVSFPPSKGAARNDMGAYGGPDAIIDSEIPDDPTS